MAKSLIIMKLNVHSLSLYQFCLTTSLQHAASPSRTHVRQTKARCLRRLAVSRLGKINHFPEGLNILSSLLWVEETSNCNFKCCGCAVFVQTVLWLDFRQFSFKGREILKKKIYSLFFFYWIISLQTAWKWQTMDRRWWNSSAKYSTSCSNSSERENMDILSSVPPVERVESQDVGGKIPSSYKTQTSFCWVFFLFFGWYCEEKFTLSSCVATFSPLLL